MPATPGPVHGRPVIELEHGITVYPARTEGGRSVLTAGRYEVVRAYVRDRQRPGGITLLLRGCHGPFGMMTLMAAGSFRNAYGYAGEPASWFLC